MKPIKYLLPAAGVLALLAAPAHAYEEGTWIVRGGVGMVAPKSDNYSESLDGTLVEIEVDDGTSVTLSGTYMFTPNWALDILGSVPFSHDIDATISDLDFAGNIGDTKHLPPTFSIQYHFSPDAKVQPFVGVGLNWTTFFDTELTSGASELLEVDELELDDSFGLAAQFGADVQLNEKWIVNFDLRWVNIETDATLKVSGESGGLDIGTVEIDPWVYSVNLGYRF